MMLLLWLIATSKVILTLDTERVISRCGEQVVPLRHKAFERLRHLVENVTGGSLVQCFRDKPELAKASTGLV